jgi:anti-anti-sigma factor
MIDYCNVSVQSNDGVAVVTVSGELDLASSKLLHEALDSLAIKGPELMILDLRELDFIDSTGISVLVKGHRAAERIGTRFAVAGCSPQVTRLLSLTGIRELLTIVDSPEDLTAAR